jgi:asparagine synthase (glutamine-hydrolysing)
MIDQHIDNKKDFTRELRAIANLEIWFQRFIDT